MKQYELTREGYIVPKKGLKLSTKAKIVSELTVTPFQVGDYNNEVESFKIYKEDKNNFYLPRYYGIQTFGKPIDKIDIENSSINFNFFGKLRPYQEKIIDNAMVKI